MRERDGRSLPRLDSGFEGVTELDSVADLEPAVGFFQVLAHGVNADLEEPRDLARGRTGRGVLGDFVLARAEDLLGVRVAFLHLINRGDATAVRTIERMEQHPLAPEEQPLALAARGLKRTHGLDQTRDRRRGHCERKRLGMGN